MNTTTEFPDVDTGPLPFVCTPTAWAIAGVCAWSAVVITCTQIYLHLRTYTNPNHQRWIVRIMFMIPIYAICSWLSLKFYNEAKITLYFDAVRNVYEAFVIYVFVSLCFEYLGGEAALLGSLDGRMNVPKWITCTCCMQPFPYGLQFVRFIKQGCLQFCLVKPLMAVVTIIAVATDSYADGDFRPDRAYLYVSLIYNTSIGVALSALLLFYYATKDLLAPFRPVLKFFIVKAVIFFAFWQGFGLMIAQNIGVIQDEGGVEAGQIAMAYQNFIICFEMVLASVGLLYGFPHADYKIGSGSLAGKPGVVVKGALSNLKHTINPNDIVNDTVRNFSQKYKKYVRGSQHLEDAVDIAESDDSESNDDERSGRKSKTRGKAKGYNKLGGDMGDTSDSDHEDSQPHEQDLSMVGDITSQRQSLSSNVSDSFA
eukprot:m.209572 g.209572  ORF g.209572 m.209572 type:complete len:426 (+) comp33044_c0_seq1:228-1505(+)